MLPYEDVTTIKSIANYYHVTYVQLDRAGGAPMRAALSPLYSGGTLPGFKKVYDNGNGVLVYQLVTDNAQTTPSRDLIGQGGTER
jgi:hypothetical protein